jgi:hypothetical protein
MSDNAEFYIPVPEDGDDLVDFFVTDKGTFRMVRADVESVEPWHSPEVAVEILTGSNDPERRTIGELLERVCTERLEAHWAEVCDD